MRVLLISANTETINMPVLPLGLSCVAEAVRNAGHEIKLVNLMDQQDVRLVLGDAISKYLGADMGIQGEGEIAFVTLLERLSQKEDLSAISGLYLSGQGLGGDARHPEDLDECALPFLSAHQLTLSINQKEKL